MKVYKMIHHDVDDTNIIKHRRSLYGTFVFGHDTPSSDPFCLRHFVSEDGRCKDRTYQRIFVGDIVHTLHDVHCKIETLIKEREDKQRHVLYWIRSLKEKQLDYIASYDDIATLCCNNFLRLMIEAIS